MEAADMLELIDLTKRYDIKSIPAVLDLNLKIGRGRNFWIHRPERRRKNDHN